MYFRTDEAEEKAPEKVERKCWKSGEKKKKKDKSENNAAQREGKKVYYSLGWTQAVQAAAW